VLSGDANEILAAIAREEVKSEALQAYADAIEEQEVASRAAFIRRCIIHNQWRVAPTILPQSALAQWREDRILNGSFEHKEMGSIISNSARYAALR